jgi:4-amino-4-deoxy-L-arabinose transferase-like glycosyltransferase
VKSAATRTRIGPPTYGRTLLLITAAGAVLRLLLMARQPLGYDEDFTAVVVGRPLGEMLGIVSRDSAPPLFYVLEWLVAQVAHGPAALRLVPVVAGIALIPLLAALARRAAGDAAGLWAAAFAAVLPTTLLSSENARMYALAGVLVVAATLLIWRAVEPPTVERPMVAPASADLPTVAQPPSRIWVAYTVAAAAAVWSDYFAAGALSGVLVAVVWLRPPRRTLALAGIATAVAFASLAPWLIFAQGQFGHAGSSFWIPPLSVGSVGGTFGQLFAGPPIDPGVPGREALLALQVVAVVAGSLALVAVRRQALALEVRRAVGFCLLACSGVVLLAAVSVWRPLLEARYAGVMWLPLVALAGVGLAAVPRRLAAALLVALAIPSLALGTAITHPETESLLPGIEASVGAHDLVAADPNHYLAVLAQGGPRTIARLHLLAESDPPWYFGTAAYPPGAVVHSVPAEVAADRGLIFWVADPGAAPPPLPPGYRQSDRRCAVLVCLTIYAPGG